MLQESTDNKDMKQAAIKYVKSGAAQKDVNERLRQIGFFNPKYDQFKAGDEVALQWGMNIIGDASPLWYVCPFKDNALLMTSKGKTVNRRDFIKVHSETAKDGIKIITSLDGKYKSYFKKNKLHRLDGPAAVSPYYENWYKDGQSHREDGFAVITDNYQSYECNGHSFGQDVNAWAKAVLTSRSQPTDDQAVQDFLRPILQKQTKSLI